MPNIVCPTNRKSVHPLTMTTNTVTPIYTSKIIKAGALLPDTKTLLSRWDETRSVAENLKCATEENIFGKNSRSWVKQFLYAFRQRYLSDELTGKALVALVKSNFPQPALDRTLYFHTALSDRFLHDVVTEVLLPHYRQGRSEVLPGDIRDAIERWTEEGKIKSPWAENTRLLATRLLLAALRDFGVLQGAAKKRLAPVYLPVESFAYIAFYLRQRQPSGERLLNDPEWRLFFLPPQEVERLFVEAHQLRLLEYYAAGSTLRITFPAKTIEEYAHVILQRTT